MSPLCVYPQIGKNDKNIHSDFVVRNFMRNFAV